MALKLSEGSNFTPAPAGLHDAVCISVVDLGLQQSQFGIKPKVLLQWELPNVLTDDGKPYTISRTFGATLHKQGGLRPLLAAWRGRDFTPEELKSFDIAGLLGKPVKLLIQHTTSAEGKTFANVQAAVKPDKGQLQQTLAPLTRFDMDAPDQAAKAVLPEWVRKLIDSAIPPTVKPAAAATTAMPDFDDDLTF
jgi:hypothetical protein